MESRRRSSRAVAEKSDAKDLKAFRGDGSAGHGGSSSDDENDEDNVSSCLRISTLFRKRGRCSFARRHLPMY
jgi:hypothetical protein